MIELNDIKKYLISNENEDAKRPLVYPFLKKLFGDKFKIESSACGADVWIEGKLLVELKSKQEQWLEGFYQALHYAKKGLTFSAICIITKDFIGVWKLSDLKNLPENINKLIELSDAQKAPSEIGTINAKKTSKLEKQLIEKNTHFKISTKGFNEGSLLAEISSISRELFAFKQILTNLDSNRIQINSFNFIDHIELLKKFFDNPIDAVHCFYAIIGSWDITAMVVDKDEDEPFVQIVSQKTGRISEPIKLQIKYKAEFKKHIENYYIFTNEGSGLTVDYYFSRFDEAISRINPEYAKQHGIFFTDLKLSKFALWFIHEYFEKKLSDKYIVLDPAAGSGNLVTSWRGHLKHKIVSELQADLLKTIERRMKLSVQDDNELLQAGFTIIPKTREKRGLNFLDCKASFYIEEIQKALSEKNLNLDKPIAFLLNPPYKNTDENSSNREQTNSEYIIDEDILAITGQDAGKERYLAFLAQIINIAKIQNAQNPDLKPILMVFTPTSWLIPRPTYINFRKEFDKYFKYENGFLITSNEFFKLQGKWPLAFTVWTYNYNEKTNKNNIKIKDLTSIKSNNLDINWDAKLDEINKHLRPILKQAKSINLVNRTQLIKDWLGQSMYDFKRDATKTELNSNSIYGGLPLKDERRNNKKTYGIANSDYIGFMDNVSPCRIKKDSQNRISNKPDRCWFRLDTALADINKTVCVNIPTPVKSYCAYNLETAQKAFTWFAITKALNGNYPLWANQFDIWTPIINKEKEKYFYALCFAFALAENRCVITKFEKDNPVISAPEVFIDNPLSTNNPDSFWNTTLNSQISEQHLKAKTLINTIKLLYKTFALNYCSNGLIQNIGLHNEPYFKYFNYQDFLTINSGLIQIRKYSEINNKSDLSDLFKQINEQTKSVKEEIYKLLVEDFKYFD